jgi:hypothetical protein
MGHIWNVAFALHLIRPTFRQDRVVYSWLDFGANPQI